VKNGFGGSANFETLPWEEIAQDHGRRRDGRLDSRGRAPLNVEGETYNPYAIGDPAMSGSKNLEDMRHQIECLMLDRPSDDRDLTSRILGDPVPCRSALARRA
jgi:hypothetical protein